MMSILTVSAIGECDLSTVSPSGGQSEADLHAALPDPDAPDSGPVHDPNLLSGIDTRDAASEAAWIGGDGPMDAAVTPELSEGVQNEPAAVRPEVSAGHSEVIALSVGLPGTPEAAPDPAAAGFRTALAPDDELTLNIAPDLPGRVLAVHTVSDLAPGTEVVDLSCSLNFYILPEGEALPDAAATGREADFIAAHGLTKLGEVDMGRFAAACDPRTGEIIVTTDTRQHDAPRVRVNREMAEIGARFL